MFGSLRNSLTVFVDEPPALFGGVTGLAAMNRLLSVLAAVGFIALFGAIQNVVIMAMDSDELCGEEKTRHRTTPESGLLRFHAVILMMLMTLFGLSPLPIPTAAGRKSSVRQQLSAFSDLLVQCF